MSELLQNRYQEALDNQQRLSVENYHLKRIIKNLVAALETSGSITSLGEAYDAARSIVNPPEPPIPGM